MSAREMLLEMNCCYMETQNGIWIDENVEYIDGRSSRLCMIDKENKQIIFQDDKNEHKLNLKLFFAIYKLIEELKCESGRINELEKMLHDYDNKE